VGIGSAHSVDRRWGPCDKGDILLFLTLGLSVFHCLQHCQGALASGESLPETDSITLAELDLKQGQ